MEHTVDKKHPYYQIPFAMAKTEGISGVERAEIAYKFSPQKYWQWLWCPEIDLNKVEEMPDKSITIHFCFCIFSDGFDTIFQFEANETWTKDDSKREIIMDGCFEEMLNVDPIDGAVEESTGDDLDTMLRKEFGSLQGGGVLAEPEAGSNQPKVTTNTGVMNCSPCP